MLATDVKATRVPLVLASCLAYVSDVEPLRPGVRRACDAGGLRRRTP